MFYDLLLNLKLCIRVANATQEKGLLAVKRFPCDKQHPRTKL